MAVSIKKKPKLAIKNLATPTRSDGRKMTASWTVPGDLTSTKKNNRATNESVVWSLNLSDGSTKSVTQTGAASLATSEINLDSLAIGGTTYTRNSFYPNGNNPKLNSVSIKVTPTNGKGAGPETAVTREFLTPRAPTIDAIAFDNSTGTASTTIRTDAGEDYQERYDTKYVVAVTTSSTGKTVNTTDTSSTSTEITGVGYNASSYQSIGTDDYIHIKVSAYARGYRGDSTTATRNLYISKPRKVSIEKVDISGKGSADKCTVHIKTNSTTEHPVDQVKLEYAADVSYDKASDIPAASWTTSDIVDDADCTALAIAVSTLTPTRGKHSFIRVKSYHLNESVLYQIGRAHV